MRNDEKTIAIAFDLNFRHAAEIFSGASDYLSEARLDWQLMPLNFGFETRLMELARSGQLTGVLGTFVSDGWIKGLLEMRVAAVNMFNFSKIQSIPTVGPDDFATGQAAARHLREQGAQHFAFFGADEVYYTRLREAGFAQELEGGRYTLLRPGPDLPRQIESLADIQELKGVFCSNDMAARELIRLGEKKGLHCGKDVLVVGVDNDPAMSIFAGIGISSFKQPIRETGYYAAKALSEILEFGGIRSELKLPALNTLIPRESSLASNRARVAQEAVNLLRGNLSDSELDVSALARRLGVSRRSLELATKEQFGKSPYTLLSEARSIHARYLLRATLLPIMEIGLRCGYPEQHHFSAWFKKQCGISPKKFREQVNAS